MYEAQQLLDTPQGCCPQSGFRTVVCVLQRTTLTSPVVRLHEPPLTYTPTLVHKGCVHTVGRRRVAIRCELLGHGGAAVA